MTERTEPHGWRVDTDQPTPRAESAYSKVIFGQGEPDEWDEPRIEVAIATGYEYDPIKMDAAQAREAAKELLEAADILDAYREGRYVPPASTFVPKPTPKPGEPGYFGYVMAERMLDSIMADMNRTTLWDRVMNVELRSEPKTKARRS